MTAVVNQRFGLNTQEVFGTGSNIVSDKYKKKPNVNENTYFLFQKNFKFKSLLFYVQGLHIFGVTFDKNNFVLSNPDSITNVKRRQLKICLIFSSESRIISINRFFSNITMTS